MLWLELLGMSMKTSTFTLRKTKTLEFVNFEVGKVFVELDTNSVGIGRESKFEVDWKMRVGLGMVSRFGICRTKFWVVDLDKKFKLDLDFSQQKSVELDKKTKFEVDWYIKFGLTRCPQILTHNVYKYLQS